MEQRHFVRETGEQMPKNKGNRGTQAILGDRKIENQDFVLGTRPFFRGEQGNRYSLGGPRCCNFHRLKAGGGGGGRIPRS